VKEGAGIDKDSTEAAVAEAAKIRERIIDPKTRDAALKEAAEFAKRNPEIAASNFDANLFPELEPAKIDKAAAEKLEAIRGEAVEVSGSVFESDRETAKLTEKADKALEAARAEGDKGAKKKSKLPDPAKEPDKFVKKYKEAIAKGSNEDQKDAVRAMEKALKENPEAVVAALIRDPGGYAALPTELKAVVDASLSPAPNDGSPIGGARTVPAVRLDQGLPPTSSASGGRVEPEVPHALPHGHAREAEEPRRGPDAPARAGEHDLEERAVEPVRGVAILRG
jgi:hypothetical protein